jgi:hypothetical protein
MLLGPYRPIKIQNQFNNDIAHPLFLEVTIDGQPPCQNFHEDSVLGHSEMLLR